MMSKPSKQGIGRWTMGKEEWGKTVTTKKELSSRAIIPTSSLLIRTK